VMSMIRLFSTAQSASFGLKDGVYVRVRSDTDPLGIEQYHCSPAFAKRASWATFGEWVDGQMRRTYHRTVKDVLLLLSMGSSALRAEETT